jgi:hypothetical protein
LNHPKFNSIIPEQYRTTEYLSDIANVVLSGSSYLNESGYEKNPELYKIGMKVYNKIQDIKKEDKQKKE